MTRLFLTRHGQTVWNLEGRMQGSKDSELTDKGRFQALQLGRRMENVNIDVVYSSSSSRAFHTAKLILGERKIDIIKLDELKEMNFGIWEGMLFDDIQEEYPDEHYAFWNTPHLLKKCPGESFEAFKSRVAKTIEGIIKENEGRDILVVAHALVVKFIMSHFENIPLEKIFDDRIIQPASLCEIEIHGEHVRIVRYSDTEHYGIEA